MGATQERNRGIRPSLIQKLIKKGYSGSEGVNDVLIWLAGEKLLYMEMCVTSDEKYNATVKREGGHCTLVFNLRNAPIEAYEEALEFIVKELL